jgi:peptidoglycan hydrolase CwlO-like protein
VNELDKIQQIRTKIDSGNERINELNNKLKQQLDSLEINLDVSSVDTIRKSGKVVIYSYDTIVIKNQ